uniref:Uncharacterized protein n=1 Tax=Romanomermis culicivorax TaxID=13658 RepID=A0A915HU36_ROMCU
MHDNVLEEVPEVDRVSFCDDKSDTFSQTEEIEAEQPIPQAQPSPHQPPSWLMEVTELAEPIFLVAQVSISICPNCQQWVIGTIFPPMIVSIPDVIIQPLTTNHIATEFPIETAIINDTNRKCSLLLVNNMPNSIKLYPNQLIPVSKHALEYTVNPTDHQVATTAVDRDLTDHEPAALEKLLPCHNDQQKLDFA